MKAETLEKKSQNMYNVNYSDTYSDTTYGDWQGGYDDYRRGDDAE